MSYFHRTSIKNVGGGVKVAPPIMWKSQAVITITLHYIEGFDITFSSAQRRLAEGLNDITTSAN